MGATASDQVEPEARVGPTRQEFRGAVASAYRESSRKVLDDGNTDFEACFEEANGKCVAAARGRYDGFSGLTLIEPVVSLWARGSHEPRVQAYVIVADCERPQLVIEPVYEGRESWLFMDRVAVMVDGAVELERRFDFDQVQRDAVGLSVLERATWLADGDVLARLRRVVSGDSVVVRLVGEKGYVALAAGAQRDFINAAAVSLLIVDKLQQAVEAVGGPDCTGP